MLLLNIRISVRMPDIKQCQQLSYSPCILQTVPTIEIRDGETSAPCLSVSQCRILLRGVFVFDALSHPFLNDPRDKIHISLGGLIPQRPSTIVLRYNTHCTLLLLRSVPQCQCATAFPSASGSFLPCSITRDSLIRHIPSLDLSFSITGEPGSTIHPLCT